MISFSFFLYKRLFGLTLLFFVAVSSVFFTTDVYSAATQDAKLTAGDRERYDSFGYSVAIDGNTAVVGAYQEDPGGISNAGSAYIYTKSNGTWSQQQKLTAGDRERDDWFGYSVAIDGNTAVVGAHREDPGNTSNAGSAYVFVRSNGTWSQQQKLVAGDRGVSDYFGYSVAIDGNTAVVGAYLEDPGNTSNAGSAYVFTRDGTSWNQQQKLTAGDRERSDHFGYSVAIDGDTAVVGAYREDPGNLGDAGSAYVFVRSGTSWSQQQKLVAGDKERGDWFGHSVAIDGNTAVVGAYREDPGNLGDAGSVYVFTRDGTSWNQQQKLTAGDRERYDSFGYSVAIDGNTAVVGAYQEDPGNTSNAGSAYVFTRDNGTWSQQQKLTAGDRGAGDYFGYSVAIDGDTAVVGANREDPPDIHGTTVRDAGSAYVFTIDSSAVTGYCGGIVRNACITGTLNDTVAVATDSSALYRWRCDGSSSDRHSAICEIPKNVDAKLIASDREINDHFGYSVAIDGDTAVVGAYREGPQNSGISNAGSAYIYTKSGTSWSQQQKLVAGDRERDDWFGYSVAIDGNTAVVGAHQEDPGNTSNAGSVYVFTRDGTSWSQQQKLVAGDRERDDWFGYSVAIDGNTAVVGAYREDPGNLGDAGSVYVFTRDGTSWNQQQKLVAGDKERGDWFGHSVAIDGNTAVVGTPNASSVYVFTRNGTSWSQQQKLTVSDRGGVGSSVAIDGNTAVVGTSNTSSAYIYTKRNGTWSQQQKLVASDGRGIGSSVAIYGNTAVVGASNAGSVYVFVRSNGTWSQQQELVAGDRGGGDQFGSSVAIDGNTAVVGAHREDPPDIHGTTLRDAGSAYVFTIDSSSVTGYCGGIVRNACIIGTLNDTVATDSSALYRWRCDGSSSDRHSAICEIPKNVDAKLTAGDRERYDSFGYSVAIDGNTAVVGAYQEDPGGISNAGSAYIYTKSNGTWSQQQKLTAGDRERDDWFGYSVAIDGNTAVVGAHREDPGNTSNAGSAYVFVRSNGTWSQQQKLVAGDRGVSDYFGYSVAIDGNTAVVGAYLEDPGNTSNAGSAYVFTRDGTSWNQQQKLTAGDRERSDHFGYSVAIDGDTAVVGAYREDPGNLGDAGSAYVFVRSGTSWSQQQKLVAGDKERGDWFGHSVAIDGNTAVVGAYREDPGNLGDAGSVYVFTRDGTSWNQQQKLTAGDRERYDSFGYSVAIDGNTAVVGAYQEDPGNTSNAGSAYVFTRDNGTWSQQQKLTAGDRGAGDYFGYSVAIDGDTAVVGANREDPPDIHGTTVRDAGSAYVFTIDSSAVTGYCGGIVRNACITGTLNDTVAVATDSSALYRWRCDGSSSDRHSAICEIPKNVDAKLIASDREINDHFGYSVAIDGDTAVVGAYREGPQNSGISNAGSAYIYTKSGTSWSQQQKLVAGDRERDDWFGYSVAIDGNTAVVGAHQEDPGNTSNAGSVYVFTRDGTSWSQQQKLVAGDRERDDWFGYSVAIDGNTAVVGAYREDPGNLGDAGSVYVFTRDGTSWNQQQKLVAGDKERGDWFGHSVAIDGNTAVVGTPNASSVYVFTRNGTSWSQQQKLTVSDRGGVGSSVAIDGNTAVVGTSNTSSAYIYTKRNGTWSQQQKLVASDGRGIGSSVAIYGNTAVVGASNAGSVYVFVRSNGTWSQQQELVAGDRGGGDQFGSSVAIDGNTAVVGAHREDPPDIHGTTLRDAGSAYVFTIDSSSVTGYCGGIVRNACIIGTLNDTVATDSSALYRWRCDGSSSDRHSAICEIPKNVDAKLTAGDRERYDSFGYSVAIDGNTAVVGAYQEDPGGISNAGSAYIYTKSNGTWSQQQKLTAGDRERDDWFGYSVAIDGNTAVVGAHREDPGNTSNAGSAYVFVRSNGTWSQQQKLVAGDRGVSDYFGYSVAIDGNTAVVGAYLEDPGNTSNAGSAYVFTRDGTSWNQQQKLTAGDRERSDHFGYSVAIDGDTAVVGAYREDPGNLGDAGSAYVFVRSGTSWSQQQKLVAGDKERGDWFGHSVAIDGNTAVVGAYREDPGNLGDAGSVYVFTRDGTSWNQQQKLTAGDRERYDSFGYSVAIDGNTAVVGAYQEDPGNTSNAGSAYVFTRDNGTWSQQQKLTAGDRGAGDYFGYSVAIDGDTAVVGANREDPPDIHGTTVRDAGSAYVFVFAAGSCDNARRNGCTLGTPNESLAEDTSTEYRWRCVNDGRQSDICHILKPVSGSCDNARRSGCTLGTPNESLAEDTSTEYRWRCVNDGRQSDICHILKIVPGSCDNTSRNGCTLGTPDESLAEDTPAEYRWRCVNDGRQSDICHILKPVPGSCNNIRRNGCTLGTPNESLAEDTLTEYRWRCVNDGRQSDICHILKPVPGSCDNARRSGCTLGTPNESLAEDTSTEYRWRCVNDGRQSEDICHILKPASGSCNNIRRNGCTLGTPNESLAEDTSTEYRWRCVNDGRQSDICHILKSVSGPSTPIGTINIRPWVVESYVWNKELNLWGRTDCTLSIGSVGSPGSSPPTLCDGSENVNVRYYHDFDPTDSTSDKYGKLRGKAQSPVYGEIIFNAENFPGTCYGLSGIDRQARIEKVDDNCDAASSGTACVVRLVGCAYVPLLRDYILFNKEGASGTDEIPLPSGWNGVGVVQVEGDTAYIKLNGCAWSSKSSFWSFGSNDSDALTAAEKCLPDGHNTGLKGELSESSLGGTDNIPSASLRLSKSSAVIGQEVKYVYDCPRGYASPAITIDGSKVTPKSSIPSLLSFFSGFYNRIFTGPVREVTLDCTDKVGIFKEWERAVGSGVYTKGPLLISSFVVTPSVITEGGFITFGGNVRNYGGFSDRTGHLGQQIPGNFANCTIVNRVTGNIVRSFDVDQPTVGISGSDIVVRDTVYELRCRYKDSGGEWQPPIPVSSVSIKVLPSRVVERDISGDVGLPRFGVVDDDVRVSIPPENADDSTSSRVSSVYVYALDKSDNRRIDPSLPEKIFADRESVQNNNNELTSKIKERLFRESVRNKVDVTTTGYGTIEKSSVPEKTLIAEAWTSDGRRSQKVVYTSFTNGVCDESRNNGCLRGGVSSDLDDDVTDVPDTATHYRWRCGGKNGGDVSRTCEISSQED